MDDELKSLILVTVVIVFLIGCILAAPLPIIFTTSYMSCQKMVELHPDRDIEWDFWLGCRIKMDSGIWLDTDDLKYVEGTFVLKED
jgi:hypothetical protein